VIEIEDIIAKAASAAPFPSKRSLTKASVIIAALDAAGFVIVPKLATEEMCAAGMEPNIDGIGPMYAAMLNARPR